MRNCFLHPWQQAACLFARSAVHAEFRIALRKNKGRQATLLVDTYMNPPHFATQKDVSASEVGELLLRAADCLHAALAPQLAEAGLNEARYCVLDAIRRLDPRGCSQAELAGRLLQSESNLSTLLERMRQDGLIARDRSPDDRRKSVIRLTAPGEAALEQAGRRRTAGLARLLDALDPHHQESLATAVLRLISALEHRLGDRRGTADTSLFRKMAHDE